MSEEENLIVWVAPASENAQLIEVFEKIAAQTEPHSGLRLCYDPAAVRATLTADKAANICLVYTAPEEILCQAIHVGKDPAYALENWALTMCDVLTLHRQNRRCSMLFESTHLSKFFGVGLNRLGVKSSTMTSVPVSDAQIADKPLLALIARAHLQSRSNVVALREEADASAQLLSNDAFLELPLSVEMAVQNYRSQHIRQVEAEQSSEEAWNHNRANIKNLEALQTEVVKKDATSHQQQAMLNQQQAEIEVMLKENSSRIANLEALNRQKQARLDQMRSDNEALTKRSGETAAVNQSHVRALELEIGRIMGSRSMRITSPLRRFVAFFRGAFHE